MSTGRQVPPIPAGPSSLRSAVEILETAAESGELRAPENANLLKRLHQLELLGKGKLAKSSSGMATSHPDFSYWMRNSNSDRSSSDSVV